MHTDPTRTADPPLIGAAQGPSAVTAPVPVVGPADGGFLAGLRDATPAGLAAVPLGLAFGVLVAQSGLDWWWGTLFAAVVFAGSFEFLLLGLVTAGAALPTIALTALLVNVRHVFYSLSFPLHRLPGVAKVYGTFALTDEAWALTASPQTQRWRAARILAIQGGFHLAWVASVTVGALTGALVPDWIVGLDFALTALFVVLGIDAARARRDLPAPFVAVACAAIAGLLVPGGMLVGGIVLFVVFLLARIAVRRRASRTAASSDAGEDRR